VPFFEVQHSWAPFLPGFSEILPRRLGILSGFSKMLPRFSGILLKFSTNQNFWGCAYNSRTPASYTTALTPLDRRLEGPDGSALNVAGKFNCLLS